MSKQTRVLETTWIVDGVCDMSDSVVIPIEKAVDLWIEIHRTKPDTVYGMTMLDTPSDEERQLFDLLTKRLLNAARIEKVTVEEIKP